MIIQKRSPSHTLQVQKSLNNRMKLTSKHKRKYEQNQKGYEGELVFDQYVEKIKPDCLILNDVQFNVEGNRVQIDSLFISDQKIYIFEVKNFTGEFHYREGEFHLNSETEILNPINQVKRSKIILTKLLHSFQNNIPVESAIVFINKNFVLYQDRPEKDFILFNQIENQLNKIKKEGTLQTQQSHQLVRKILDEQYLEKVRYEDLPDYDEKTLKKGVTCQKCHSFFLEDTRQLCKCLQCGHVEKISDAIKRSTREYQLLLPEQEITKSRIYHWTDGRYSTQRIQRVLSKNYSLQGTGKTSFYT